MWQKITLGLLLVGSLVTNAADLRPPAVPLLAVDPFFSVWSPADKLTDAATMHWSGAAQPLNILLHVDGRPYRLIGMEPTSIEALPQIGLEVLPLSTIARFGNQQLAVELAFTTPFLADDLEIFSRPLTYVTLKVRARDQKVHNYKLEIQASSALVVDKDGDEVALEPQTVEGLVAARMGRTAQPVLGRSGDQIRIDWGYFWLAAPKGGHIEAQGTAAKRVLNYQHDFKNLTAFDTYVLLAYDDVESVMFFDRPLKAWWRRHGLQFDAMLAQAARDYPRVMQRVKDFNQELVQDLKSVGGEKYARIAALAYRQSLAACKLVADPNQQPLLFSKENASNGCMGTVDVFYPQLPLLALLSPTLTRATLAPILLYASDARWPHDFAPHDIGQYPLGNAQAYGAGEHGEANQMPVEECGNMLICLGVLSQLEKSASFARQWWPTVTRWANYLATKGFDPEHQLCTDDFAGHLAHNANLSLKAIMALASYARMCELSQDQKTAEHFMQLAQEMAEKWQTSAKNGRNGAYRLAFDQEDSWSMKYNLVWDKILGFGLFPAEVAQTEMALYRSAQQKYGLPLDNRKLYTKADWLVWCATLTGERQDFETLIAPLYQMLHETPSRVPFSDWYQTDTARHVYFKARSVVGGMYLPLLYHPELWNKYAARDKNTTGVYAPLKAKPGQGRVIVHEGRSSKEIIWQYTTTKPGANWFQEHFDARQWSRGPGGFGRNAPNSAPATLWNTSNLWLRREFTLDEVPTEKCFFSVYHDEDAKIYLNGTEVATLPGFSTNYKVVPLSDKAQRALRKGKNLLAVSVLQTGGGQYFDLGIKAESPPQPLRVASFNVRVPMDKSPHTWPERAPRCVALIQRHKFDIVGLQEAVWQQMVDLTAPDGWSYVGVGRDDGAKKGEFSSIIYRTARFKVLKHGTFWLSETPEKPGSKSWKTACTRVCTWAEMWDRQSERSFMFFNTHLDHVSTEAREKGTHVILERMAEYAQGRPIIFTGDFNTHPDRKAKDGRDTPYAVITSNLYDTLHLSETPHQGPTKTFQAFKYEENPQGRPIDFIFVSTGVRVLSHMTLNDDENKLYPSDHFPVAADIIVE